MKRRYRGVSLAAAFSLLVQSFVFAVSTAVFTIGLPAEPAVAHSVGQVELGVSMSPETQQMILDRGVGLLPGDVVEWIVSFTPVPNGAEVGPNGYVTFYPPGNTRVVGASVVQPSNNTFVDVPVPVPETISAQAGSSNYPWPAPFDNNDPYDGGVWEQGTLPQVYADTGIFYSTDPRTEKFVDSFLGEGADPNTTPLSASNGYYIEPTGCGQLIAFVGDESDCRTHNLWDADMTNAFGSSGVPGNEPRSSQVALGDGRGNVPYLAGSPVAGPQTFYGHDNTGTIGPWQRIQYPGSMIGYGDPGIPVVDYLTAYTPVDASNEGIVLNGTSPLPSDTNAVRWAIGGLRIGEVSFVKVALRIESGFDSATCVPMDAEVFGGDAALVDGGKDNQWRYHVPAPGNGNACLALTKTGPVIADQGDRITYEITFGNIASVALDSVTVTDILPPATAYVSANPAPASVVGDVITWPVIPSLGPGETYTYTITADITGAADFIQNEASAFGASTWSATALWVTNTSGISELEQDKTVSPSTAEPDTDVTYTVTITNPGNDDAENLIFTDVLDTGLTYVPGTTLFDGAAGSDPTGTGTAADPLVWDLPIPYDVLAVDGTLMIEFDAHLDPAIPRATTYTNDYTVSWTDSVFPDGKTKTAFDDAPVYVPGVDLAVVKTDTPDPVAIGGNLTYTVNVTSNGPADATGVLLTDPLPAALNFVSASHPGCSEASGVVTCALGDMPVGSSVDVTIETTVDGATTPGLILANTASVVANENDENPSNNSDTEPTLVDGACNCFLAPANGAGDASLTVVDKNDPDPATNEHTVGSTGVDVIEAMTLHSASGTLYGTAGSTLGTFNLGSGAFDTAGFVPFGAGNGSAGYVVFDDVRGLDFDPYTGLLWAVHRRAGANDVLFLVDPDTGARVYNPFGPGVDYLEVTPVDGYQDVSDLAFSPVDGTFYASFVSTGATTKLATIDPATGTATLVGDMGVEGVEAISVASDGRLEGVSDVGGAALYDIDPTGATHPNLAANPRPLDDGTDYRAMTCAVPGANSLSGTVFNDVDETGTFGGFDVGEPGITVNLYRDADGNGVIDPTDPLIISTVTSADGTYSFSFAATGDFVVDIDDSQLPAGHTLTTDNLEAASFVGFGLSDPAKDFGFSLPSDLLVTKGNSPTGVVFPGDTIAYTITVENTGLITHTGVEVYDPLPDGTTYDAGAGTVVVAPSTLGGTYADDFLFKLYSNSTGTLAWAGDWAESEGTPGNPGGGDARIDTDGDASRPAFSLRIEKTGTWVQRSFDLSPYDTASLDFLARRSKVKGSTLFVQVAPGDTGPWTTLLALDDGTGGLVETSDPDYVAYNYDIGSVPGIFSSTATVRFQVSGGDRFWIDDVVVTASERADRTVAGDPPATLVPPATVPPEFPDGFQLEPGETMTVTYQVTVDDSATVTDVFNEVAVTTDQRPLPTVDDATNPLAQPAITVEKSTNGADADAAPGPLVPVGDAISWSYVVTNTGNVDLTGIAVVDDQGVTVTCPGSSLVAGDSMTCTASGTATAGQYANLATVTGTPPVGGDVGDTDASHYFGSDSSVTVEKSTNGSDADTAPGPLVAVGDPVAWTYEVSNTGNVDLTGISVVDDQGVTVTCPTDALVAGDSMTCTGSGTAALGQYANLATVTGTPPVGGDVSDTDASHYFGSGPGISVEKSTNGTDADAAPGPFVPVGDPIAWSYVVTNTGNVDLTGISVVDDQGVTVTCSTDTLVAGDSMTCTASGTATAGQYANLATVTAAPPSGPDVSDTDPSHYFGSDPSVSVEKSTNGSDADSAPGPLVPVGDPVSWSYVVSNTGNVDLTGISVVDDQGVTVTCPTDSLVAGDSMTCSASGTATAGQYANLATVTGTPPVGGDVGDTDASHYFGSDPSVTVEKSTNGSDADSAPGPLVPVGDPISWTYLVANTGNVDLTGISVVDDQGVTVTCPTDALVAGDSMTCTGSGTAALGQYANLATATATPPVGGDVSDTDASHYFGSGPGITVEKWTNGADADSAPGPLVRTGDPVAWSYRVLNTGNVDLTGVAVVDDQGVTVTCPADTLAAGDLMVCTGSGTAVAGQYANLATVTGTPPVGSDVADTDPSHYFGSDPSVTVEKSTNGADADVAPGPFVPVGDAIAWTYEVTNTGNADLTGISVVDDQGVTVTCPTDSLVAGDSMTCSASGTATAGQYANLATVTGTPPVGGDVGDTDASHYFGSGPGITVEKSTNGSDADAAPGPLVLVGDPVAWTYVVSNTGNVDLTGISVVDDQGVTVTCPTDALVVGDSMTCTGSGTAALGQYANLATVTATPPSGPDVSDTDPSHYFGSNPSVTVEKSTNGSDADAAPGPFVPVGDPIAWSYVVTNTGNVDLTGISVVDDQGVTVTCPTDSLVAGDSMTCSASGTATAGQYANLATVTGTPPVGGDVSDTDASHYFGSDPSVSVEKSTNGSDADSAPGPFVTLGDPVAWTYLVTNAGNVDLTGISVVDDQGVTVTCPTDALVAGDSMTCTASGTATVGQYSNLATVTGTPPVGGDVGDTDASHYFGSDPSVTVEKSTNGADADTAPGPLVPVGDAIAWTYEVTNTGNVDLTGISVVDDQGVTVTCPTDALVAGDSMTCSASGTATAGQYANLATVTGTPPAGSDVADTDPSHYFGSGPGITVEKSTNGADADSAPGPLVPVGDPIAWTYEVTNTGNVDLTGISVVDDQGVTVTCPTDSLVAGDSMTCSASGTATAGQYANLATVTGTPPVGSDVSDTDASHYYGSSPSLTVEKSTNGADADSAPGPLVPVGDPVSWTYLVTNTGNVDLTGISVVDDQGVTVTCPTDALVAGDSMTCTASGTATAGQYANLATVTGTPPVGGDVSDTDASHYFGSNPSVTVEKSTNGADADSAPGPLVPVGDAIAWTYEVTNTGNVDLTGISVVDDQGVTVTCPTDTLVAGDSMTCTGSGTATAGQYANLATVTGTPPVGGDVSDIDASHYFGSAPSVTVEKSTNGSDADTAPGPFVAVGDPVSWTYEVTNTGNVDLTGISVVDDQGVTVTCPTDSLVAGDSMTCTASGIGTVGQYANLATVSGTPPVGGDVGDTDASHYFGSDPSVTVEKSTNGSDADAAPGPLVPVGDAIAWTYEVSNTGNVDLTGISVVDDQGVSVTCPTDALVAGDSMTCSASGTATAGQYANLATVTGTPPVGGDVGDTDASHYFGSDPSVTVEKSTNGSDADSAPGPLVPVGDPVSWTYLATNTGNVDLTGISVVDDQGVTVTCPTDSLVAGDSMTCSASGTATVGQYANLATVAGTPPVGGDVGDTDASHYFGSGPGITVEKSTNGSDADSAPGPLVPVGDPVAWTYEVSNTGNVDLTGISVVDDQGVTVTCPTDTLVAGDSMTCTASGTATAGQYVNVATVIGTPSVGGDVSDTDSSHYFGSDPSVTVEKWTNGADADSAPGPLVPVGDAIAWTYEVTNTGNVDLTGISVVDDQGVTVTCPTDALVAGDSMTCSASGTATAGQYANLATVTGTPPVGGDVSDIDASHYYGSSPSLTVEKSTNGSDADTAPGPFVAVGDPVSWTYEVTNTGNVDLTGISVVDDQGVTVTCPTDTLIAGDSMTCSASGTATAGQYANLATVTGTPPVGGDVGDTDPSHYFGSNPSVTVEKSTNGSDADAAPGPLVLVGDPVSWTYLVTNTGNADLTGISVTDDQGVTVTCPTDTLVAGDSMTCTASGIAIAGQYANLATVTGTPPVGSDVADTDPSHYFGSGPGITVEKSTNGADADAAPGPLVPVGDPVSWTYLVTNTGNVDLTGISVVDDQGVTVTCPTDSLVVGDSMTCTASGTATAGQYANLATVTGTPPVGGGVGDTDSSHYFGSDPSVTVEKSTNGADADAAPGPLVPVGDAIAWTYEVTNTGNVDLTGITVVDDQGVTVTCPTDTLVAGDSMTCTGSGTATAGQYANLATVTGTPPVGGDVGETDSSHYFGSGPGISVEKSSNGADADTAPGPLVPVGDPVAWTYEVTNTGNVDLTGITVVDDQGVTVTCPTDTLVAGDSMTCSASGTATVGQYANLATVTGSPSLGPDVSDTDASHYFGSDPSVTVEKSTNGSDADAAPGPFVPVGDAVSWTYLVTNTGNVDLTGISVTDDQGVTVTCPTDTLVVGDSMTCSASGTATAGQYANLATVTGTPPVGGDVGETDASHYYGSSPSVTVEKSTNGSDADAAPGPLVPVGDPVSWTYEVANTGNVDLTGIAVVDDQGVTVTCPTDTLIAGDSMTCTASGTATAGQYANLATVTGTPPVGSDVSDTDASHYYGSNPSLTVEKSTNGSDADTAPGPLVPVGDPVSWTYEVTNTGNVDLTGISVVDDQGVTVTCPTDALVVGDSMTCTGSATATAGQYANLATVTGTPPVGGDVGDTDSSHYYGSSPSLTVEKWTNGSDADTAPGPLVPVGDPISWTYEVTNTGNVDLTGITVVDDQGVTVTCPTDALVAGDSMTCTGSGTATSGQYANLATVAGTPPVGGGVGDTDASHYFGSDPSVTVEKSTNGSDADAAPGPFVPVGDPISWTYEVSNTGNVDLTGISVVDDQGVTVTCPTDALVAGDSMTCSGSGASVAAQYANLATVTASPPVGGDVSDTDASHYFGVGPGVVVEKSTNGFDADAAPGPLVEVGDPVSWTYEVSNTGNVDLTGISVVDDQGVTVTCPTDALVVGDSMTCSASGTATAGQYANLATVTGTPPVGADVSDIDASHYFGSDPSVSVEKSTNGSDADSAPGPLVPVGDPVSWTYLVANTGNVDLTGISVVDDQGVTVTCPTDSLATGDSMTCTGSGTATAGQYANLATVTGTPPVGGDVGDTDASHYYGSGPSVTVEKSTNGSDADSAPGPLVPVGDPISWTYLVANTGNVDLTGISVVDDQGVTVTCPTDSLATGDSMTCTGSGTATAGQYANLATVTGTPPVGGDVGDTDASHYFGSDPSVTVEKSTNGSDADSAPGPLVPVGDPVSWTYEVTNTGNVDLAGISVVDDQGVTITCPTGTLVAGDSMTCSASGTATAGQYANLATVTGTPPVGGDVGDTDASHYFGSDPSVTVEKSTNGSDADAAPGPLVPVGDPVAWTYEVSNTGNVDLTGISVVDDQGVTVTCPTGTLIAGDSMTCTGSGTATSGQYANLATVTGTPPVGGDVSDTDASHYYGSDPSITVEKSTNGSDADAAPGPLVPVGDPVSWTYEVSNTGNVDLTGIAVVDDQGVTVTCPTDALVVGDSMTCSASGTATAGQYANLATVTGTPPVGGDVGDTDASHYFGSDPSVSVEKSTNGSDADAAPGPLVPVGDPVSWTYLVANTGNVDLTGITVVDDQGVTVTCPIGALVAGDLMVCTASGIAIAGQYANLATVTGTPPVGGDVSDTDASHYFGSDPAVSVEKSTNGSDADAAPGPLVPVGGAVSWTYEVTNTGNVNLTGITVVDDQGVTVTCPTDTLVAGDSMTCSASGTATVGQYANLATVTGTPPVGGDVGDTDASHYFGSDPSVTVEKSTNGSDADAAPGPFVPVGDAVSWTYLVTNTGNVDLTGISVVDDQGVIVTCPTDTLIAGDSMTCSASGTATSGQYANLATVTGTPPVGGDVGDTDSSHYYGSNPSITVEKSTNGSDADAAPGPLVPVGDPVSWTYLVANTGNVDLTGISVVDDQGVTVTCPTDSLVVGDSMACSASGTATSGQYANLATVTGTPPVGGDVGDIDASHYFGSDPSVTVEKSTNGSDADAAPGPLVPVGDPVSWTYEVTNTGNVDLTGISVVDDQGVTVTCPTDALVVGDSMTCIGSGIATVGQYANLATVTGTPPVGGDVGDTDSSHYFGSDPSVTVEKSTNGSDADAAPGPLVPVGDPVSWTYEVSNTGNVDLTGITVVDDQGVIVTCPTDTLVAGDSMSCSASGTATAGQYANLATVTGTPPVGGDVGDVDSSHYYGSDPSVTVEKSTNGSDADAAPGPLVPVGGAVSWTYEVTNTGNVNLTGITVVDDQGVTVTCPTDTLVAGDSMTCSASGTATVGQYANLATVTGTPPVGGDVGDTDASHYFGSDPSVTVEKSTNGSDADAAPGPFVPVGDAVSWTYLVTNTGNVDLTGISVVDDQGVTVTCPTDTLIAGDSMTCSASGTATSGQYANLATVTGTPPVGGDVGDIDASHYFGSDPSVSVEKSTNGSDADSAPGPLVPVGDPVSWTYEVMNTGNVDLTGISVTDDQGVTVTCPTDTLIAGDSMTCSASGTATVGQYANLATVTGTPPVGGDVGDTDASHYFGSDPSVSVEKSTNGSDADSAPGPLVPVGDPVAWTYEVMNTGNVDLTGISVTDDQGVTVTCPTDTLIAGDSMTCSASGTATAGQYANLATVTGTPPVGGDVGDTDASHYFGSDPSVTVEKSTNGSDADSAPGPLVPMGDAVSWTYLVTNTGNVDLTGISVVDDQGVTVTCPTDTLVAGDSMTCSASGTATVGQYANLATVTGSPSLGPDVSDTDASHYFGSDPSVTVEKSTNGSDADTAPGPLVPVGDPVSWTYEVTNTGNVDLTGISVTDDQGVTVTCPTDTLVVGDSMTCSASGTATAGQYANLATVTGTPPVGGDVSDTDASHYYGSNPSLTVEKSTNGSDADTAPGPLVPVGDPVSWTYEVTNTGNVDLTGISVTDDQGVTVTCPTDTLVVGDSMTCSASGTATAGQYANLATVTGTPPVGGDVSDTDASHYYGSNPSLTVEKSTNGSDADTAPGPLVPVGDPVSWTYEVTNTGNVDLTGISVTDDQGVTVTCPTDTLVVGDSMTCSASGTATAGQYANLATVTGTPPVGGDVSDTDASHYYGSNPSLTVEKSTNGSDADTAPGPLVPVGDPVSWTYEVTNTGNVDLTGITVVDDQGVIVTCPADTLIAGDSMTCTGSGTAVAGQYANLATVTGTPPVGGDVSDTDASYYYGLAASVGDLIWDDRNADGIQQAGEPGIAGADVNLYLGPADPANLVASTSTGPDGSYLFSDLPPGDYTLAFALPGDYSWTTANAGADDSIDSDVDPATGATPLLPLADGTNRSVDGGAFLTAAIGDRVWADLDGDGIQDGTEPGLEGIVVRLFAAGFLDVPLASTATTTEGAYGFSDLAPGDYVLEFIAPAGYVIVGPAAGSDRAVDSDPDPTTGLTAEINVTEGTTIRDVDAGLAPIGSIGNRVWFDRDADGLQDADEAGLGGVTVLLTTGDGDIVASTTTSEPRYEDDPTTGSYLFEDLMPGIYVVSVDPLSLPDGLRYTTYVYGAASSPGTTPGTDPPDLGYSAGIGLAAGAHVDVLDFGFAGTAIIGDTVWIDRNTNGIQDLSPSGDPVAGEEGIPNIGLIITWAGPDGLHNTRDDILIGTRTTDVLGKYLVSGLPLGAYEVMVIPTGPYRTIGDTVIRLTMDGVAEQFLLADFPMITAELPRTGSDTGRLAGMGLLLVLLGAMMVAIVSRRREDEEDGSKATGG